MKPLLDSILPFSASAFFWFMAVSIVLVLFCKVFLKKAIPFKWVIGSISVTYIFLLYPKPLHVLGLIAYLYFCVIGLRKWYASDKVAIPMVLLALPMILMKSLNVLSEDASNSWLTFKHLFQIAGISYMVFKAISLYVDRRSSKEVIRIGDAFLYLSFVPTLLIGPLDRFDRFLSDVKNGYENIQVAFFSRGWDSLILGLLYKFVFAEGIRRLILSYLENDGSVEYHVAYMYTYLVYLFFDFAGYSLLAVAFGNFLGVNVPSNFNKPFLAINPKEFWKRWHITLGDWLNDYFFKPIFKYLTQKKILKSIQRQGIALFLTFTLMGFWNGFELHYILSGMLFGFYSVAHNYYVYKCKKGKRDVVFGAISSKIVRVISIVVMFNLVAFAIYIFSGNLI